MGNAPSSKRRSKAVQQSSASPVDSKNAQDPQFGEFSESAQVAAFAAISSPRPAEPSTAPAAEPRATPSKPSRPDLGEEQEDLLQQLAKYDTAIVVDDSGSMAGALWSQARAALAALARLAGRYDADGIDIHFMNSPVVGANIKDDAAVLRLFARVRPGGRTPLGARLDALLSAYISGLPAAGRPKAKPLNIIVITDGVPTDDLAGPITAAARRLDAGKLPLNQVGIQFVQVGRSRSATEFLQRLDDGLAHVEGVRDIVDTVETNGGVLTEELLIKALLGGINRKIDRQLQDQNTRR